MNADKPINVKYTALLILMTVADVSNVETISGTAAKTLVVDICAKKPRTAAIPVTMRFCSGFNRE